MNFDEFTNRYLTINQEVVEPLAYAVDYSWYLRFQSFIERMFIGEVESLDEVPEINNKDIAIYVSSKDEYEALSILMNMFQGPKVINHYLQDHILKHNKLVMKDYVVVSAELWSFLKEVFKGGPSLPLCVSKRDYSSMDEYITHLNLETIPQDLAVAPKNICVVVVFQTNINEFVQLQMVVPSQLPIHSLYKLTMDRILQELHRQSVVDVSLYFPKTDSWHSQFEGLVRDFPHGDEDLWMFIQRKV